MQEPGVIINDINHIDVTLVLDVTGSMQNWINSARRTLLSAFSALQEKYPSSRFRLGCVCYRDIGDADRFVLIELTDDIQNVQTQLQNVNAKGGLDTAEDVAGALQKVCELNWNENSIKIILWVADAPAHGTKYHDITLGDRFPKGDPNGLDPYQQVKSLAQRGIDMTIFRVNKDVDKMIEQFAKAYEEYTDSTTFTILDVISQDESDSEKDLVIKDFASISTLTSGFIDLATYDDSEKYGYGEEKAHSSYDTSYFKATQDAVSSAISKRSKSKK